MAIAGSLSRLALNDTETVRWTVRHKGEERGLISVQARLLSVADDEVVIQFSASDDGIAAAFEDAAAGNPLWLIYARGFGWISFGIGWLILAGNALLRAFA